MSKPLLDDVALKLIDAKLVINGTITTNDIYRHLGLTRQKASRLFQLYLQKNPEAMAYVPSKRKYIASKEFRPHFLGNIKAGDFIDATILVFGIFEKE